MVEQDQNNEITLKELLEQISDYFNELKKYWLLLPLFVLPSLAYQIYNHITHETTYTTKIKFIVEANSNSSNALSGFLGQFGFNGSENGFGPKKIGEVVKSKSNISSVILDTSEGNKILGNQLIEEYELISKWKKNNEKWIGFKFKHIHFDELDSLEQKAFVKLYGFIAGSESNSESLMKYSFDEDTRVMSIKVTTTNPMLSEVLVQSVFDHTREFFEIKLFEDQEASHKLLKEKKDSLEAIIQSTEYEIANFSSSNRGIIDQVGNIPLQRLERKLRISVLTLGEVIKSYEFSDYNLKSIKPYFFVLDKPIGPITPQISILYIKVLVGLIIGGIFWGIYVCGRKLLRDVKHS